MSASWGRAKNAGRRDEEYPLADYRYVTDLLRQGRSYVSSIDDDDADPASLSLLRRLEKESQLAVPVMYEGAMWGELWATGTRVAGVLVLTTSGYWRPSPPRYRWRSAGPSCSARSRGMPTKIRSRGWPIDARSTSADADSGDREGRPTLLVCDLDGLKEVNDRDGHPAGDALLRGVAGVLSDVASAFRASLVARLGGHELCVVLPAGSLAEAERFARTASRQVAAELGPDVSLCWGAAARGSSHAHRR